jgi:hypothetical protein
VEVCELRLLLAWPDCFSLQTNWIVVGTHENARSEDGQKAVFVEAQDGVDVVCGRVEDL